MRTLSTVAYAATLMICASAAQAESLACAAGTVAEGDSRLSLLYKCGQPVLSDTACDPVYHAGTLQPVPDWLAQRHIPCRMTERLLYERGQGQLLATVQVQSGIVRSITYGRQPR